MCVYIKFEAKISRFTFFVCYQGSTKKINKFWSKIVINFFINGIFEIWLKIKHLKFLSYQINEKWKISVFYWKDINFVIWSQHSLWLTHFLEYRFIKHIFIILSLNLIFYYILRLHLNDFILRQNDFLLLKIVNIRAN